MPDITRSAFIIEDYTLDVDLDTIERSMRIFVSTLDRTERLILSEILKEQNEDQK
jgi:hypothetical protein